MTSTSTQSSWDPGLDNGHCTLRSVYQSLPGTAAIDVPWYVRLVENPRSPLALAGAVDLFGHDCIHVVLGRGLLGQDEAFVLGFTMGSSSRLRRWEPALFRYCAEHLYRGEYRFDSVSGEVFQFAVAAAQRSTSVALNEVDFRLWLDRPISELRAALGVRPTRLRQLFATEARRWPGTAASARMVRVSDAVVRAGTGPADRGAVHAQGWAGRLR